MGVSALMDQIDTSDDIQAAAFVYSPPAEDYEMFDVADGIPGDENQYVSGDAPITPRETPDDILMKMQGLHVRESYVFL
jgi:hypothetical protein